MRFTSILNIKHTFLKENVGNIKTYREDRSL